MKGDIYYLVVHGGSKNDAVSGGGICHAVLQISCKIGVFGVSGRKEE